MVAESEVEHQTVTISIGREIINAIFHTKEGLMSHLERRWWQGGGEGGGPGGGCGESRDGEEIERQISANTSMQLLFDDAMEKVEERKEKKRASYVHMLRSRYTRLFCGASQVALTRAVTCIRHVVRGRLRAGRPLGARCKHDTAQLHFPRIFVDRQVFPF